MSNSREVIELLRHYRHDWLNVLQLIKGNLALNKLDRVEDIINDIVLQSENESKLSNLHIPSVAELFFTFNWTSHYFRLEYEVSGEIQDLSRYEEGLNIWCKQFFEALNNCCAAYSENSLLVTFQLIEDDIKIIFDFHGGIEQINVLEEWLNNDGVNEGKIKITEKNITNEELVLVVSLK